MLWRWFLFLIFITLGVAMGLIYGWVINPPQFTDTSPEMLKMDYVTDYVLMVAESYNVEPDLPLAIARLGFIPDTPPALLVGQAIGFGEEIGYHAADLQQMQRLLTDLQAVQAINP